MIVKICGIARPQDAAAAVRAGADWIGINFWPGSRRAVDLNAAPAILRAARSAGTVVIAGVFVNQSAEFVDRALALGLDRVQLHGDESPEACARWSGRYLKAIALRSEASLAELDRFDCDPLLIDTPSAGYGGSGQLGDWSLARAAVATGRRILLAGGLTPDNVAAAIAAVGPAGVDVAGGVETPTTNGPPAKDEALMRAFVAAARDAGGGG